MEAIQFWESSGRLSLLFLSPCFFICFMIMSILNNKYMLEILLKLPWISIIHYFTVVFPIGIKIPIVLFNPDKVILNASSSPFQVTLQSLSSLLSLPRLRSCFVLFILEAQCITCSLVINGYSWAPTNLLNQNLWRWGPENCFTMFTR